MTAVWNGTSSTDWNTADNWTPSGVPLASAHIQISTTNPCNLESYQYLICIQDLKDECVHHRSSSCHVLDFFTKSILSPILLIIV